MGIHRIPASLGVAALAVKVLLLVRVESCQLKKSN